MYEFMCESISMCVCVYAGVYVRGSIHVCGAHKKQNVRIYLRKFERVSVYARARACSVYS